MRDGKIESAKEETRNSSGRHIAIKIQGECLENDMSRGTETNKRLNTR